MRIVFCDQGLPPIKRGQPLLVERTMMYKAVHRRRGRRSILATGKAAGFVQAWLSRSCEERGRLALLGGCRLCRGCFRRIEDALP